MEEKFITGAIFSSGLTLVKMVYILIDVSS